ncbi:MAG: hypothetical protein DMG54_18190 [Acidobacteria bacterium]|nr:MAG: hypothetical protein DMG54_18190 [Acidobacteriota bacterium]PYU46209.1 MAG: hypothetical protein DMG53_12515 [Acidobacteriota bacterium]PYU70658.1 MAG: hypothetical protein DMG52_24985 [Acidobacteriota bacterium]
MGVHAEEKSVGGRAPAHGSSLLVFAMIAPVYERVFELTNLTQGKVNRAIAIQDIASGCSITAARAACQLGATVNLVTTAGGHTGLGLRRLLADEPFMTNVVQVQAETRNVITLLTQDSTGTTVVVEPSRAMSVQDIQSFHRAVSDCSADSCYVLLGGSLPPDVPADSYASLVAALQSAGRIVAVDTRGNAFEPCVRAGARIIKTNSEHLPASVDAHDECAILRYLRSLTDYGTQIVICSADDAPTFIVWHGSPITVTPPRVRLRNQFGSGDAALGAFLWALQGNQSRENALRLFVAVGAANAETRLPGCFSPKRVYELMEQIQIHPGSLTE